MEELVAPEPSQVRLSKKAQEVLVGVAEGWSSAQIGKRLHLSARTVEWHITQAMKRLDAKNRVQAVVLAMQKGGPTLQLMLALLTDF